MLESVYAGCMQQHNNKSRCSASAWTAAKNAGWRRGIDGKWHKKSLTLTNSLIQKLKALPETGMGYQRVDVVLSTNEIIHNVLILNSSVIVDYPILFDINDIREFRIRSKSCKQRLE